LKFTLGSSTLGSIINKTSTHKKSRGLWAAHGFRRKKNDQSIHGQTSPFKIKIETYPRSLAYHFSFHDSSVGF